MLLNCLMAVGVVFAALTLWVVVDRYTTQSYSTARPHGCGTEKHACRHCSMVEECGRQETLAPGDRQIEKLEK